MFLIFCLSASKPSRTSSGRKAWKIASEKLIYDLITDTPSVKRMFRLKVKGQKRAKRRTFVSEE